MTTQSKRSANSVPDALPARFNLKLDAFVGMAAATLNMPYGEPLKRFTKWLEEYFKQVQQDRKDENGRAILPYPPYRLLNDVLTACAPTIVHGFEKYDSYAYDSTLAIFLAPFEIETQIIPELAGID